VTNPKKSVLIAGATGGLGQQIAAVLAAQNYSLMLVHRTADDKAKRLKESLKGAQATFYQCDFTQAEEISDAIDLFFEQHPHPYGLVNLIGDPVRVDWQKGQISHLQEAFLQNASAPLCSAKEFGLRLQKLQQNGAIVLFSTMQAVYPFENSFFYGTSKAALLHGARILAKEFGGDPFIRLNVVAPGVNEAGMAEESIRKGKYSKFVEQKIIPRYGRAADLAKLVLFLLDPDLYMTGQTLLYDGGLTLRRDLLR
jgi:NAD(P)-dependent dehydrogenase (short-subunit alcohol dehydrogenase family)